MGKKFVWLDGSTREAPDPNWNLEAAQKAGLISAASRGPVQKSASPPMEELKRRADYTRHVLNLDTDYKLD